MKKALVLIAAILAVPVVAFFAFGYWMFGGESEKEEAAIHFAESVGDGRLAKLAADCEAIVRGRPLLPTPYKDGEYSIMWDDQSGFPAEFRDFRPMRAYIGEDGVTLMTYKCFDEAVLIDISGLKAGSPLIVLRYGDYQKETKKVLWQKKPIQQPQPQRP